MKFKSTLFILFLGFSIFFNSCKSNNENVVSDIGNDSIQNPSVENSEIELSKLDADGNYTYKIGDVTELTLSDNTKLNVGSNSTETKIFNQLNSEGFTVNEDKTKGWITLDRVYFSKGNAEMKPESETQIKNISAILRTYPNAQVKIGGYTDNTGNTEINQKISAERANAVAQKMITNGVNKSRIENEGFGADHFVCPPNDTEECKAQNRRVDIRITKK